MTRYELLDRIGVGGMAEIFRGKAVAAGGFEKPVAIKRILPHLSQDKRFVELLIAEAKVLSLLKHRNIVQIFDVGLGDDAQYFLVMEFVDGKDLGAVQRTQEAVKKRLPYDLALHIGAEVCEALEHAHSARAPDGKTMSLVHRDVSPSNVLLSRAGEVKLTDFGIAKRAEAEQTGHGAVRGKFAYISPEQARNEHIEPRSDVFSVGILLWEMVTGRRLFSGLGDLEALRAVREAQVQRPRAADPQLSSEIDALIMSALARDPKRRPTAGQLGEKLRSIRYSLEITGGDPATELAKIIDTAEARERESHDSLSGFDVVGTTGGRLAARTGASGFEDVGGTEATMIHIRTAAEFAIGDSSSESIKAARQVIDRFEEEETRLAQLSGDQLRMLRDVPTRDSSEMAAPPMPAGRSRRATDEPTTARPPIDEDAMTRTGAAPRPGSPIPHLGFDGDEATRLVAPTNRRTPAPERIKRAGTVPPPVPLPGVTVPARPPLPGLSNAQAQRARNLSAPPPPSALGAGPPPMPNLNAPPPMPADARPLEDPSHHSFVPGTVHSRNPSTVPPPTAARALPPHLQAPMQLTPSPGPQLLPQPQYPSQQHPSQQHPSQQHPSQQHSVHSSSQQHPSQQHSVHSSSHHSVSLPPAPHSSQQYTAPQRPPMQQPMQPPMRASTPQLTQPPLPQQPPYAQHYGRQSAPDMFAQRSSAPRSRPQPIARGGLQPWMLVVGALIMAALAFLVTRVLISG